MEKAADRLTKYAFVWGLQLLHGDTLPTTLALLLMRHATRSPVVHVLSITALLPHIIADRPLP